MADIAGRSLTWTFICYPESMPENWLVILRDLHIIGAVSPLHDKDVDDDGIVKKAHYHVLLKFPSKKSLQQVYSIVLKMGSHVMPEPVESFEGMLRYLIHADDPEKYQYTESDIIPLCGLDIHSYFLPPKSEVAQICYDICSFLFDHPDIDEFDILYGLVKDRKNWGMVLTNFPCYGVVRILNSRRFRNNKKKDGE
jgi:hypothetical protein